MDGRTPGFPVRHQLLELTQTVHGAGELLLGWGRGDFNGPLFSSTPSLISLCLALDRFILALRVYLLHADEEGVDEVPWGVGVQCALVLLHLLGYEVLQSLQLLKGLLLWPWQIFHH